MEPSTKIEPIDLESQATIALPEDPGNTSKCEANQKPSTKWEIARFSAGFTGNRLIHLTIEIFIVIRTKEFTQDVARAGFLFLIYTLASIVTAFIRFRFPTLFFGSNARALSQYFISQALMIGGFIAAFNVDSYGLLMAALIAAGAGGGSWALTLQTLSNLGSPKEQLGQVAVTRVLFETIGFLLPGIILVVMMYAGGTTLSVEAAVIDRSATALGVLALAFNIISFDQTVIKGAQIRLDDTSQESDETTMWGSVKTFFGTSVVLYFAIMVLLMSFCNVFLGTISIATEAYFGLKSADLAFAVIGLPLGSMLAAGYQTISSSKLKAGKSTIFRCASGLVGILVLLFALSSLMPLSNGSAAKATLFCYGLVSGIFYAPAFAASDKLWMTRLKDCTPSFVSRASVVKFIVTDVVIAGVFQLVTFLVDTALRGKTHPSEFTASAVLFLPLIILLLAALLATCFIQYPKESEELKEIREGYSTSDTSNSVDPAVSTSSEHEPDIPNNPPP